MRIYIDITECRDANGKILFASPDVKFEVEIGEGYDIEKLSALKDRMQKLSEEI